jgi:hypothetical protein
MEDAMTLSRTVSGRQLALFARAMVALQRMVGSTSLLEEVTTKF